MRGTSPHDAREHAPHLRLVSWVQIEEEATSDPEGDSPELSDQSTLTDVFQQGFLPNWADPKDLDPKTIDEYERSLALWRRLAPDPDGDGHEPRLWELRGTRGDRIGGRFMALLATEPGNKPGTTMSAASMRKHARNINKLLSFSGPRVRSRFGRKNLGLIDDPTLLEAPAPDEHAPEGDWTFDEVREMYIATSRMESLNLRNLGIDPVLWWRAILIVAAHTGLRRGQILGLSYADLTPPFVLVRPKRSKRRTGKKQYLSQESLAAIEAIRTTRERIFPWPYFVGKNRAVNVRYLDLQLRKLAERAGLPRNRWFGWNGFRKLAGTAAYAIAGEKGAQAMLGHASGSHTAMKHYVAKTALAQKAAEIIDHLPSPRPQNDEDLRQGRLF